MSIQLADVLDSRIYVKENSGGGFQSPRTYLEPFLDRVKADEVVVKVQDPVTNQNEDGTQNVSYPRVLVEAKVGSQIQGYDSVIGFLYALDIQHPLVKVFTGQNAHACTNLTIFNADNVYQMNLLGNLTFAYEKAEQYFNNKQREIEEFLKVREELVNTYYDSESLQKELGRLLMLTTSNKNVGYPSSGISQAAKWLQDKNSIYHVKADEMCSKMNLYDSLTQSITNSNDVLYKPNKTLAVAKMLIN